MKEERPLLVSAREFLNGPQLVTRSMDPMEPLDVAVPLLHLSLAVEEIRKARALLTQNSAVIETKRKALQDLARCSMKIASSAKELQRQ